MQTRWVHYPDITVNEVTTVVKVVRVGPRNTRVLLSNGRNDMVPSAYVPPIAVGDKVVLCPYPNSAWTSRKDATLASLRKKYDEGKLTDEVLDTMAKAGFDLRKYVGL